MGRGGDGLLLAQIALGGVCGLLLRRSRFWEFTGSCCADRAWFPEVPPGHIRSARGLDSASLHLARGASPYGKRQSPSRLCASTTRLGDCLLPHCSLPIRTVYHNPPPKTYEFFLTSSCTSPTSPLSPPFFSPFPPLYLTFPPFSLHFSPLSSTFLHPPHTFPLLPPPFYPHRTLPPFFPHRPIPSFHFFSFLFPHHPHTSFPLTHVSHLSFSYIPLPIPTYHIPPPRPHHILPFLPPTAYGFQNIRQL